MTYSFPRIINPFFKLFFDIKKIFFFLLFFIIVFPKIPLISTGFATPVRLEDFIVVYLWFLFGIYILLNGKIKISKNIIFFWIGLYLFWALISTMLGFFRGNVTTPLFFLRKIEYISLFFFAYIIIDEKNISEFYNLVFISLGIVVFIGFLQYFKVFDLLGITQKSIPYLQPANVRFWSPSSSLISSTFDGNYDLGGYLILIVPFLLLLLLNYRYSNKKIIFLGFLSSTILVLLSGARGPTIILFGLILIIFTKRIFLGLKKQMLYSFFIFILLICIFFLTHKMILRNFLERVGKLQLLNYEGIIEFLRIDQSVRFRAEKWSLIWDNFLAHPLFGIGIGGFANYFIGADGQHIQTLGETGLVGFILFLILFFYVIKMNNQTERYLKGMPLDKAKELDKTFLTALSIGILGLMLNGITINVFDASKVAMCLWVFIGVTAKLNVLYKYKKYKND